jgi:hypothetical protein
MYKAQAYDFTFATVLWPDPDSGVSGEEDLPAWADATQEQRGLYAYFADDDGLIDGDTAPTLG